MSVVSLSFFLQHTHVSEADLYWAGLTQYMQLAFSDQEQEFERFYQPLLNGSTNAPPRPKEVLRLVHQDNKFLVQAPREGLAVLYNGSDFHIKVRKFHFKS